MKKAILAILIVVSVSAIGQTSAKSVNADSVKQAEVQKMVTEIVTKTPIQVFQEWLFETMTAKQYNDFIQYYNAFIQKEYNEKLKKPK